MIVGDITILVFVLYGMRPAWLNVALALDGRSLCRELDNISESRKDVLIPDCLVRQTDHDISPSEDPSRLS